MSRQIKTKLCRFLVPVVQFVSAHELNRRPAGSIDDWRVRLSFDSDKIDEIHHHTSKEHGKSSTTTKLDCEMF